MVAGSVGGFPTIMKIGKFEILAELGQGAMGKVYRALDPHLDRVVALKTVAPGLLATPDARARGGRGGRGVRPRREGGGRGVALRRALGGGGPLGGKPHPDPGLKEGAGAAAAARLPRAGDAGAAGGDRHEGSEQGPLGTLS